MTDTYLDIKTIVKKWIELDNELSEYKLKIRDLNSKKKEITTQLAEHMDNNNIDGFNINNDSKLVYKKKTVKGSVSKKLLVSTLSKYFSTIKTMCNYAYAHHDIKLSHKFNLIKLKSKKSPIIYLNLDELRTISRIDEKINKA